MKPYLIDNLSEGGFCMPFSLAPVLMESQMSIDQVGPTQTTKASQLGGSTPSRGGSGPRIYRGDSDKCNYFHMCNYNDRMIV
jgi:hypothetical protein